MDGLHLEAVGVMSAYFTFHTYSSYYLISCHYVVVTAESPRPHAFSGFKCATLYIYMTIELNLGSSVRAHELQHPTVHAGNGSIYNAGCAIRAHLPPGVIKAPFEVSQVSQANGS